MTECEKMLAGEPFSVRDSGIAGNWLGARSFASKGAKIAKPLICIVLAIFFVRILWELLSKE